MNKRKQSIQFEGWATQPLLCNHLGLCGHTCIDEVGGDACHRDMANTETYSRSFETKRSYPTTCNIYESNWARLVAAASIVLHVSQPVSKLS